MFRCWFRQTSSTHDRVDWQKTIAVRSDLRCGFVGFSSDGEATFADRVGQGCQGGTHDFGNPEKSFISVVRWRRIRKHVVSCHRRRAATGIMSDFWRHLLKVWIRACEISSHRAEIEHAQNKRAASLLTRFDFLAARSTCSSAKALPEKS
jgi:hypothetical protein